MNQLLIPVTVGGYGVLCFITGIIYNKKTGGGETS